MFCRNCGQENRDGAKFCTGCGAVLDEVEPGQGFDEGQGSWSENPGDPADAWGQPDDWGQPEGGADHTQEYQFDVDQQGRGKRDGLGAFAIAMVVLAVLCVVAVGALGTMYFLKVGPFAEVVAEASPDDEEAAADKDKDADRDADKDRGDKDAKDDDKDDTDADKDDRDDTVSVPSVTGAGRDDAVSELELLGLDVVVHEEHSSTVAEGFVIDQSLSSGDDAEPGDTIVLTVSLGPEMTTVSTYTFVHQSMTWEQARQWCEDNGGHLATISSADELNQVLAQLPAEGVVSCWLGGYRTGSGWAWVDGSSFAYSAWASGEPNNEGGNENYLTLLKVNGNWSMYDVPNDVTSAYSSSKIGFVMETEEQVPVS